MNKLLSNGLKCLAIAILATQLTACAASQLEKKEPQTDDQIVKVDQLEVEQQKQTIIVEAGERIETRFLPPAGFQRINVESKSYAAYLRSLPLKPHGSSVLYYNGDVKHNNNVYVAVLDMKIGDRDLEQCADAIMRLRGEYLYGLGAYESIHFNFTNGFRVDYSKWVEGYRIVVDGNRTYWEKRAQPSNTYQDFKRYMNIIYAYAGTISLEKELVSVELSKMEIGDVLIQGGSPGHAVVVVDMAINEATGEKVFLLAQSYMPAQETQILVNPNNSDLSPWYSLNSQENIIFTPEWTFKSSDLKRFP